jgi:DNA-binding MarR family transcriptional regulator
MNPPHDDAGVTTDGNTGRFPNLRPAWKPGQSGNLDGRSISLVNLAMQVRRLTRGGAELIELHLAIARGELIPVAGRAQGQRPNLDQRMQAAEWLASRGWGKAKEVIELAGEASPAQRLELLRRLSAEDRDQLRAILTRALNGASVPASDDTDDAPALAPPTVPDSDPGPDLPDAIR